MKPALNLTYSLSAAALAWAFAGLLAGAPSHAQTMPDPSDPKAPVTPLKYQSAFEGYKPYTDEPLVPWKAANDKVREIGGWRAYARQASEPDASTAPAKTGQGHGVHHGGKP
jgi:hypothetical protein